VCLLRGTDWISKEVIIQVNLNPCSVTTGGAYNNHPLENINRFNDIGRSLRIVRSINLLSNVILCVTLLIRRSLAQADKSDASLMILSLFLLISELWRVKRFDNLMTS